MLFKSLNNFIRTTLPKSSLANKKGFSLVEVITVVAILGILLGVLYVTLWSNWESIENHSRRTDFWYEVNRIFEEMTFDARRARSIDIDDPGTGNITINFQELPEGGSSVEDFSTYELLADGTLRYQRDGGPLIVLTEWIDLNNSLVESRGRGLFLNLTLAEDGIFGNTVAINTSTEIFPRN